MKGVVWQVINGNLTQKGLNTKGILNFDPNSQGYYHNQVTFLDLMRLFRLIVVDLCNNQLEFYGTNTLVVNSC